MAQRRTPDDLMSDEELQGESLNVPESQVDAGFHESNMPTNSQWEAVSQRLEEQRYRQSAIGSRAIIVDALYPPLILSQTTEGGISFEYHIAPTSYQESFKSRWMSEDQSHGYLNPKFSYGGTERQVSMSFVLPAMTVSQARNNLEQCSKLSRTVYGRYRHLSTSEENQDQIRVYSGERKFTVDFGSLIRDEKAIVDNFTFTVDSDAGVFDYEDGGDTDVTHSTKGLLLPRQVSVDITFVFIHDNPLGFGSRTTEFSLTSKGRGDDIRRSRIIP